MNFTRLRADPDKKGLLYAGTESGLYISFDDGNSWKPFQQNLPIVPITDLTIKDKSLIVATQRKEHMDDFFLFFINCQVQIRIHTYTNQKLHTD